MTRNAAPHGPTTPLSDDQPHPGTRGPSEPSGREVAAEGRAGGPTEGEIEAAARVLHDNSHHGFLSWDEAGEYAEAALYDAKHALIAALPLIEARLREPADRVRALHHEQPNEWWEDGDPTTDTFGPTECAHDYRRWPCDTIRALDGPS